MGLWDDIQPYLDEKLGLPLGQGRGRDNILKDTAVLLALLSELPQSLRASIHYFFQYSEIRPGLYLREPGNLGRNSVDNLVGAAICGILGPLAGKIRDRGKEMNYTYSILYPDTAFSWYKPQTWVAAQDWYGRFIGIPSWIRRWVGPDSKTGILFLLSVIFTTLSKKGNTSDKVLMWLMVWATAEECMAKRYWRWAMTWKYGNPAGLFAIYYGPEHPFTKYAPEVF